jgi:hypothetical protein
MQHANGGGTGRTVNKSQWDGDLAAISAKGAGNQRLLVSRGSYAAGRSAPAHSFDQSSLWCSITGAMLSAPPTPGGNVLH